MGLILLAAWVATFAIGGVLQALGYFFAPDEVSASMALGGAILAALGTASFVGMVKKKSWALGSFIALGVFSIAQLYLIKIMPLEQPATSDWLRMVAASIIYTLVAYYVYLKLNKRARDTAASQQDQPQA